MKRNVGTLDAVARGLSAGALVVVAVSVRTPGVVSFLAILTALILMATALTRECPIYRALHVRTLGKSAATPRPRR